MERRGLPHPTPSWMLLTQKQLRDGLHLPQRRHNIGAFKARTKQQKKQRYAIVFPDEANPWAKSSASELGNVFGDDELGERALALFQSSLQPTTYRNYGSNMTPFFNFCDASAISPLEVTNIEVARYVAWMGVQGTVAADSLQPYLSAINKFLLDHAKPPVALGAMVAGVRKGLANCQHDLDPSPERLPIPAPVVLAILELAERLLKRVHWDSPGHNNDTALLRACIASIASYIFFCRGECGACARREDLVVDATHITLRLRKEKGKKSLREGRRTTRQILKEDMPRVANVLQAFFKGMHMKGQMRALRWAMSATEDGSK